MEGVKSNLVNDRNFQSPQTALNYSSIPYPPVPVPISMHRFGSSAGSSGTKAESPPANNFDEDLKGGGDKAKKRRTSRACDVCNRRKVKCDSAQPNCSQCAAHGLQCTYSREAKKRGPKQGHLRDIESKLKGLDEAGGLSGSYADDGYPGARKRKATSSSAEDAAAGLQMLADSAAGVKKPRNGNSAVSRRARKKRSGYDDDNFSYDNPASSTHSLNGGYVPGGYQYDSPHDGYRQNARHYDYQVNENHRGSFSSSDRSDEPNNHVQNRPAELDLFAGNDPEVDVWAIIDQDFETFMGSSDQQRQTQGAVSLSDMPNPFGFAFDAFDLPSQSTTTVPQAGNGPSLRTSTFSPAPVTANLQDVSPAAGSLALPTGRSQFPILSPRMAAEHLSQSRQPSSSSLSSSASATTLTHSLINPNFPATSAASVDRLNSGVKPTTTQPFYVQSGVTPHPTQPHDDLDLPILDMPLDALEDLLELFFKFANPILGNCVHETRFRTLGVRAQTPLLLNSMYAMAARFSTHPILAAGAKEMYSAGDVFYGRARVLVSRAIDVPSTDTVSSLIMLVTYAAGSGRAAASWMYSGMAIRMAQSLKLDLDPDFQEVQSLFGPQSWYEKEHRRRLWWVCFVMDRYTASAADRSMLVLEKDSRVFPPLPRNVWFNISETDVEPGPNELGGHTTEQLKLLASTGMVPRNTENLGDKVGTLGETSFDCYLAMARIYGRVMEYAAMLKCPSPGMPGSIQVTNAEAEQKLISIEAALREWLSTLPDWIRHPGRRFADNFSVTDPTTGALTPPSWEVAYLHIFYNTTVVLLNRPKMMAHLQGGNPGGANSCPSFVASQHAATAVATLLEVIMDSNPDFFWFTPFVAFCIFQTSLVHVVAAQTLGAGGMSVQQSNGDGGNGDTIARSEDVEAFTAACRCVRTHLRALRRISRFWLQGWRLSALLQDLFASVESVGDENQ